MSWIKTKISNVWRLVKMGWVRFKVVVIGFFIGGVVLAAILIPPASTQSHVYLARWEWFDDSLLGESYWRAPFGDNVGTLDLRTLPNMEKAGGIPEGYGIFVYEEQKTIFNSVYFGTDLNVTLTSAQKKNLEGLFGITEIKSDTPVDFMWDILTEYSDPTGQTAPKPLRSTREKTVQLMLGGFSLIREEPFTGEHIDRTVAVFQEDYRRNRAKGVSLQVLQRWTGHTMKDIHGKMDDVTARSILPPQYINDGWQKPQTTISDNFNRADEELNVGSWVEVNGDWEVLTNEVGITADINRGTARHTTALSTDDMRTKLTYATNGVVGNAGVLVRLSSDVFASMSNYRVLLNAPAALELQFYKTISGTVTSLDTNRNADESAPDDFEIRTSGSSMKSFFNSGAEHDFTDTSLTGELNAGMQIRRDDDRVDDFEAEDLAVVTTDTAQTQVIGTY